jgi:tetratricopeptide (TPR) repeat protein
MTVFSAALERGSAAERQAYLDRACADDPHLRHRVEALLRAHDRAGGFLGRVPDPAETAGAEPSVGTGPAAVIAGRYKLLERIGEGGMGEVWMAEQTEPVRRKVAIKLIRPGMDSRQVLARFEAERQALAMMDHANIAKVLDAGAAENGGPYFVMELVKGTPITRYCDDHKLTTRERLALFGQVCSAVQHAHQKGLIHRDLKPSNVLVAPYDGAPVPKVIDFGVAKAAGQPLTEKTLFTGIGAVVGTPEYMSPEQAELNNQDIDTRSDVYALGVLLYELLTGTTPLTHRRLRESALLEVLRLVREEEPPKPSTRLSTTDELPTVAANRGTEPRRLSGLVRGELDWIVMKALEKDRTRRYATANGLGEDVRRYLADEPVQAGPPSAAYRLRKFARRNKAWVAAAAVLVIATAVSAALAVRATLAERRMLAERDRAEANFRMARDVVDRYLTQVSQSADLKSRGMEQLRRRLLQNAREFYGRFVLEHTDAADVRHDLGLAHQRLAEINRVLGDYPAAEDAATRAVAILGELANARPQAEGYRRDLVASHLVLGLVYSDTARWELAQEAYDWALAIQEPQAAAHPESAEDWYALAKAYSAAGYNSGRLDQPELAVRRCRQALAALGKAPQGQPAPEWQSLVARTQFYLGRLCLMEGWFDEAETALNEAARVYGVLVRGQPDAPPEDWQALGRSLASLGSTYTRTALADKAEESQQHALKIFQRLAREHDQVPEYVYDLGRCEYELGVTARNGGRLGDALARYDKAIEMMTNALDRGYAAARPSLMGARTDRATTLARQGSHARAADEAEALAREDVDSTHVYNIACIYSTSSAAAGWDLKLSPVERARLKERYADRAMTFLRKAVAQGYRHPDLFKKDLDLEALRARDDFQTLISALEAQRKNSEVRQADR